VLVVHVQDRSGRILGRCGFDVVCTMSRPILDRLGFEAVAEQEVLLDPATC
jgi:hypothetical protein